MHTKELIELATKQLERKNVLALAERLEVANGIMYEWRNGTKPIPDERIRQLAKIAKEDAGKWLLLIRSEQDKGELGKEWEKLYKKLTATAATLLIGASITCPNTSQAQSINKNFSNENSDNAYYVHYVHQVGAYKARCLASPKNGV
ncbi:DUF3693 domain-containing protein [Xylella fastidiosa subsp. multiplex]|uniref:DUF3693 domain-containing protein n=1 Tax=Xylella fastidiosa TaxID=2371 RepID=UPI0009782678|nr:DUF3693 domain-containing protein [Xylella fastidiosa]KAJ4851765.1 DUF3693 domain-containing protein [Xylella fastidiosa subsp. multiplex]MDC6412065.1 DUF3693 domain-containing protein [Xylella fastidiosa subsp. multiplex]MDC6415424.1 DUF3693 domain-containing protein [Xylella fastidiosa subsp. multiplex]MDC6416740.1 DUF3693 domain-containing protein [Xylella fastidiosa subsp. multiplex]MDC6416760.1 DUF3693 domain-containing protein [Xylella fastidiosa subsp. multiplex]